MSRVNARLDSEQHKYIATRLRQARNLIVAVKTAVSDRGGPTETEADAIDDQVDAIDSEFRRLQRTLDDLAQRDCPGESISYYGARYVEQAPLVDDDSGADYAESMKALTEGVGV